MSVSFRWACAVALFATLSVLFSPSSSNAGPRSFLKSATVESQNIIEQIGRRYKKRRYRRRNPHRHYKDGYVKAPYTYVDTYDADVVVDAPYARVRRSRRGVRIRAPYVDLYVPY